MAQHQIDDIIEQLSTLRAEMAVLKTLSRLVLWVAGAAITGTGSMVIVVFTWWLNKH